MSARVLVGKVVSLSGKKTVKVEVPFSVKHSLYRKIVKKNRSFLCHNEIEDLEKGVSVEITEGRPYSKLKSWKVVRLLSI